MPITLLDGALIVIMLISALLAMVRGFSREVFSVASWAAAGLAALFFFQPLMPYLADLVPAVGGNSLVLALISGALIFLVVLVIVSYLTMLVADMIIDSRIGPLDRTLGFIFGAARGWLLVTLGLMGFLGLAENNVPPAVADAKSLPALTATGDGIQNALPENLVETISNFVKGLSNTPAEPGAVETETDG
jgi:membrane protein required for colicin V production